MHENELKDTWQVYLQTMIQMKADVYLYSKLDPDVVKRTHLEVVENMDNLLEELMKKYGPGCRVCVLPEGPHMIPYLDIREKAPAL